MEEGGARVWDLSTSNEVGLLKRVDVQEDIVKCLQVEDQVCVSGHSDGKVALWNLQLVDNGALEEGVLVEHPEPNDHPTRGHHIFEGHTQSVTSLYFEDECLVMCQALGG
jgi:mitochondrial division protein 1